MDGVRRAVARVMGPGGEPVGGAFLVAPGVLLTAAHVVNLASGAEPGATDRPKDPVTLSFAAAPGVLVRAELAHWVPPGDTSPEDIAGLRLLDPAPAGTAPAPLAGPQAAPDRAVVTFGFPRDAPSGGWGRGRLAGSDARGLVQIDIPGDSAFAVERGFSGTPVWDVEDEAVAGLVVEGWTRGRRSGFVIPSALLLAAWPWLAEQVRPASPFRGLTSFGEQDAGVFFGRDELAERIAALSERAAAVTVSGPSGVGKSSLLHAGVVPKVRARAGVLVASLRPSQARTPLRAVALALARAAEPGGDPLVRGARVDALAARLARGLMGEVVGEVLDKHGAERLVLVVDQFEEALLSPSAEELEAFAAALRHCRAPSSRLALLIAVRTDFVERVLRHGTLGELVQDSAHRIDVADLGPSALRAVIEEPVRRTRTVRYEPGLVDRILRDVGPGAGRLPLLQFTLTTLWDRQESGVLTHAAYGSLGGVENALARHAEAVWDGLGDRDRIAAGRLLVQLLYPLDGRPGFVRRAASRAQLDAAQWAAAGRLSAEPTRLVVTRRQDGALVVELTHDALVTHWSRLAELGEHDRAFREWQETVRLRLRRGAPLLAGADLREALRWRARRGADLAEAELTYLDGSRRRRARRRLVWSAAVVVVCAVAAVVVVQQQESQATAAADDLMHHIDLQDPYATLRTTLRAYKTSADVTTEGQLSQQHDRFTGVDKILPDFSARPILLPDRPPVPVAPASSVSSKLSADGRRLVTTDPRDGIVLWQIDGATVTPHALGQTATSLTISRDGRYVAFLWHGTTASLTGPHATCDGVCLLDTTTGRVRRLGDVDPSMIALAPVIRFDPAGATVAAVVSPDTVHQHLVSWDVASGRKLADLTVPGGEHDQVYDAWLAPGGRRVLLDVTEPEFPGSRNIETVLASLDLSAPDPVLTPITDPIDGRQVAMSADGTRVAALVPVAQPGDGLPENPRARLVVFDLATLRTAAEVPASSVGRSSVGTPALDPHGDRILLSESQTETVWPADRTSVPPSVVHLTYPWQAVVPLGPGADSPLLVATDDVVGLVLPRPGGETPAQRLGDPLPSGAQRYGHDDEWCADLLSRLADGVEIPGETTNLPAGTYRGPIGG